MVGQTAFQLYIVDNTQWASLIHPCTGIERSFKYLSSHKLITGTNYYKVLNENNNTTSKCYWSCALKISWSDKYDHGTWGQLNTTWFYIYSVYVRIITTNKTCLVYEWAIKQPAECNNNKKHCHIQSSHNSKVRLRISVIKWGWVKHHYSYTKIGNQSFVCCLKCLLDKSRKI